MLCLPTLLAHCFIQGFPAPVLCCIVIFNSLQINKLISLSTAWLGQMTLPIILYITGTSFYWVGHRRKVSAPIYLNNVGCYGHENKLTDCSYGTHTIADKHRDDIGIHCNAGTGGKPQLKFSVP